MDDKDARLTLVEAGRPDVKSVVEVSAGGPSPVVVGHKSGDVGCGERCGVAVVGSRHRLPARMEESPHVEEVRVYTIPCLCSFAEMNPVGSRRHASHFRVC